MEAPEYLWTVEIKHVVPYGPPVPEWQRSTLFYDSLEECKYHAKIDIDIMNNIRAVSKYRFVKYARLDNDLEEIEIDKL